MTTAGAIRDAVTYLESLGIKSGDIRAGLIQAVKDVELLEDAAHETLALLNTRALGGLLSAQEKLARESLAFACSMAGDQWWAGDCSLSREVEVAKALEARRAAQQDDMAVLE